MDQFTLAKIEGYEDQVSPLEYSLLLLHLFVFSREFRQCLSRGRRPLRGFHCRLSPLAGPDNGARGPGQRPLLGPSQQDLLQVRPPEEGGQRPPAPRGGGGAETVEGRLRLGPEGLRQGTLLQRSLHRKTNLASSPVTGRKSTRVYTFLHGLFYLFLIIGIGLQCKCFLLLLFKCVMLILFYFFLN